MLVRDAVARVRRHLGGDRDTRNRLDAAVTAGATTVDLEFDGLPTAGSVLEIGAERMFVWSVTGQIATVERGFDGTTAVAHSAGDLVAVDPRFPGVQQALSDELDVLASDGLFQLKSAALTYDYTLGGVELSAITDEWLNIYGVEVPTSRAPDWLRSSQWHEDRTVLRIDAFPEGSTVTVYYSSPFGALGAPGDDVADTGLPVYGHELLTVGAAMSLMAGKEAGRVDFESSVGQRRPEEVEPGHPSLAVRMLAAKRSALLGSALARQEQLFPTRTA